MSATGTESRAVMFALGHFKASTGIEVDPAEFEHALRSGHPSPRTEEALEAHLREADPAELANLVIDGVATFASLKRLADQFLPQHHPSHDYIARFLT